jgi:hypothetical protein
MKNKPHKSEYVPPQVALPIIDPKPYPLNAARSALPSYGVYKISFPNGDCVVYGSWNWKSDSQNQLNRAAEGKNKNKWFTKAFKHFGRAKVELLACPLHLDYLHDIETHLATEHKATLNFRPHTFKIKLWLFCKRMAKYEPNEGFVSDQIAAPDLFEMEGV